MALVLALLLAGCSVPEPDADAADAGDAALARASVMDASRDEPVFLAPSFSAPPPVLAVSASLAPQWLKPFGSFEAVSTLPAGARVAWFVEHEEVEARATVVDGEVYVLKATTPDHHLTEKRSRADLAGFAADGRARAMRFDAPGRYTLAAGDARLVVNVWPDAPLDGPAQAFLLDASPAARFDPPEVDLASGARLLLWNYASGDDATLDLLESGYAAYVPLAAHGGRVTPIDEGLYRLTLLARDGEGAKGIARVPFLVDFERPSERVSLGPYTGRFTVGEGLTDEHHRATLEAKHPLRALYVRVNASSMVPAPASVALELTRDGEPVAATSTVTSGELALEDLPAGRYEVRLRPEHGVGVAYELFAEGRYVLPTPERLRSAST